MTISAPGRFFDGIKASRYAVSVALKDAMIEMRGPDSELIARWPCAEIAQLSSPQGLMRLGLIAHQPDDLGTLPRLEIRDPVLASAIAMAAALDRRAAIGRRERRHTIGLCMAATACLVAAIVFVLPALADTLMQHFPTGIEQRLGRALEAGLRSDFERASHGDKSFECGQTNADPGDGSPLSRLAAPLAVAAQLPVPLTIAVVRRPEPRALTLPGGRIYLFDGLLQRATNPDELASAIAREIGHVARRDALRAVLRTAGPSFALGAILRDRVSDDTAAAAARAVLDQTYSQRAQAAADRYGIDLTARAEQEGRASGRTTVRASRTGESEGGVKPMSHRQDITAGPSRGPIDATDWIALKHICEVS